ncbi:MAG TPA: phosphotransferase [Acidimicrobiales bacterium]|nr:phosphotransferase [Acidimicrobiales bacterium]
MTVVDARWVSPEWLEDALGSTLGDAQVVSVDATQIGTGQMATCVRLVPEYDRFTSAPASLVVKVPAADPSSRTTAAALRSYEIEVRFYRELAPGLPVRAPQCYRAEFDPATTDFLLLLEDIRSGRQGDQLAGCTPDEAAVAIDELPKLHAPRWGDTSLAALDWLHRNPPEGVAMSAMFIASLFPGFRDRYEGRIDADVMALAERLMAGLPAYLADRAEPWTVTHGDYRLDNLLFATSPEAPPVAVVDWQTVVYGPGVSDVSYFVGAGLLTDDRRTHERDLVQQYHAGLTAAGVPLGWDDCWEQYRRYTFGGLIMAIAASMLVEQTDRGDDMFVAMAQRHGRHALDLDATDFLP